MMVGRTIYSGTGATPSTRSLRRHAGFAALLLSTTALTAMMSSAQAADTTWDGSTSTDWFDASNWDTNAVPTAVDDVSILGITGSPVIESGNDALADVVAIGNLSTAGLLEISGAGSTLTATGALVGAFGPGSMALTLGASGTFDYTHIGYNPNGAGLMTVDLDSLVDIGTSYVGFEGTGTLSLETGGDVSSDLAFVGTQAGSEGTVHVDGPGTTWTIANGLYVGYFGVGDLEISNGGVVASGASFQLGEEAIGAGSTKVTGTGSQLLAGGEITVGEDGTGTLTISDDGLVSVNAGAGTLHVAYDSGSNGVVWIGAGFNEAATGAGTLDAAAVQFGAGAGYLVFNHTDADYTFDTAISGLGTLYNYDGVTNLTGDASAFTGQTNVYGGSLYVNNLLGGLVVVNDEGTLGGSGTLNLLALGSGGTLAPGNSVGILNVAGATFASGSTYEVELNDGGNIAGTNNDIINATGPVTINGGTVHVTPENGTDDGTSYVPGTTYHILYSADSVVGAFDALTDDFAFLNFVLNYHPNNVFLTSSVATSFCLTDMTVNQCATGDGVFSLGSGDVFDAVLTLSDVEAPAALDQLSGELHASVGTALLEDSRFAREAALNRVWRTFDMAGAGAGAWAQGFGSMAQWDGDGNAAAMDRDIGGLFVGGDAPVGADLILGLMGGYSRSQIGIDDRGSSGTVDTYTLGAYGGGDWDGFALRGGATYSWHSLETARAVDFTGFSDNLSASYGAHTLQGFGEAAYSIDTGSARFEPFANLAYVSTTTDGFTEAGGAAALTSTGDVIGTTFTTLGLRADATVTLGEVDVSWNGMLGWRHGFGDTPEATLAFATGGDAFTVAGVPITADALVLEAGLDLQLTDAASLGLAYGGQFSSALSEHAAKASFGVRF